MFLFVFQERQLQGWKTSGHLCTKNLANNSCFCLLRTSRRFEIILRGLGACVARVFVLFICVCFVFFLDLYPRSNLIAKEPEPESETVAAEPEPGEETTDDSSPA